MEDLGKNHDDSLNRRHFARLHERIQNKYIEMQKRLEKSKSVDSLTMLNEDYVFVEHRQASNTDVREIDEMITTENNENSERHSVIIEEVCKKNNILQYVSVRQVSVSESETTPSERNENDNDRFFGDEFSKMSLESLNEVPKESDECQPSPTPPPTNSIRNKIGSRISAVKDKRRQKEKERNATREMKKESREKVEKFILSNKKEHLPKLNRKVKVATVTIALIEATSLETDIYDEKTARFLFCRFRLGTDKYKSKMIKNNNTSKVKWLELFNFNLYEDNIVEVSLWDKDFCMGRSFIDLSEVERERTHKMRINLEAEVGSSTAQIFILLTISGISLANTLVDLDDYQEAQRQLATVKQKFAWYHMKSDSSNVGICSVIVYGAKGLAGQDCYCVLELNNERLQTDTEYKTTEPNWMKIFTFDVTDVTSILDITIHDEKKSENIGKMSIPLLKIKNGEKKWYALKDANLRDRARGNNPRILVEMKLTWNLVRASIKVINPKEVKYLETEQKLDRHTFAKNLTRAKIVVKWTLDAFKVMKSFLEWESTKVNFISLIIWLHFCWYFKIWMLPLLVLVPFIYYRPPEYYPVNWKNVLLGKMSVQEKKEDVKKDEKKESFRQKIQSLQEMIQSVQNFIGDIANLGESIKNLFNFTVPFISCLAIFLIVVIAFVMFMIPTKYIFMAWGIHKFTRKILRPNRIPNNEMLDLLSRVPNDEILLNCKEIPLEEVPGEDVIT